MNAMYLYFILTNTVPEPHFLLVASPNQGMNNRKEKKERHQLKKSKSENTKGGF